MDSDVPETTTNPPVHFCKNLNGTDTNFIKGCVIYPQVSLILQCNQLLQKSHLRKNWRLETETSTHCSKNSNSLCSTILKTTWHYVCTHSIWYSCGKNEAVTTPGNGLQKNPLFQET